MVTATTPIPAEISRANEYDVCIRWDDGHESIYPARDLRLDCRCAHCISETTRDELLDPRSVPADVHPLSISQVGRYAIHIQWSDGHSTGIYTFKRLRELDPT
jgi:ATP-binding protein involved in chromosome partitioning